MDLIRLGSIIMLLLILNSCKFTSSPYENSPIKFRQNEQNTKRIQAEEPGVPSSFKVAFISDTHNYYNELGRMIEVINSRGPYSFVVVTGDLTNQGLLEEFNKTKDYLNRLNYPYLVVVGNHDLLSNGNDVFKRLFGRDNFELIYKDAHFIFFNNNNWESGGVVPDLPMVERALIASTSPHRILVAHVAPDDRDRFTVEEIQRWRTLITTYGVKYFIHGHNHNPGTSSFAGAQNVTVGAPSKKVYMELIISAGGVTHTEVHF